MNFGNKCSIARARLSEISGRRDRASVECRNFIDIIMASFVAGIIKISPNLPIAFTVAGAPMSIFLVTPILKITLSSSQI